MINSFDGVFRIYLSHTIRGKKGNLATDKDIEINIRKACWVGEQIKAYLIDWEKMDGLPKSYLYVPGEHDEFVQIVYNKKWLTEEQILGADCDIIDRCHLVIAYGDYHSKGMEVEIKHAAECSIPIYFMNNISPPALEHLKSSIILISSVGDL
jgi:hypothetical protein